MVVQREVAELEARVANRKRAIRELGGRGGIMQDRLADLLHADEVALRAKRYWLQCTAPGGAA